jgi:tetratricopeptide (TPR) repeat protein
MAGALRSFYVEGDFEAGSEYLEQLADKYPGERDTYVVWAQALDELGDRPVLALRRLQDAIERDPGNLQAIAAFARQLTDLGEGQAARDILNEAIRRNPQAADRLSEIIE